MSMTSGPATIQQRSFFESQTTPPSPLITVFVLLLHRVLCRHRLSMKISCDLPYAIDPLFFAVAFFLLNPEPLLPPWLARGFPAFFTNDCTLIFRLMMAARRLLSSVVLTCRRTVSLEWWAVQDTRSILHQTQSSKAFIMPFVFLLSIHDSLS